MPKIKQSIGVPQSFTGLGGSNNGAFTALPSNPRAMAHMDTAQLVAAAKAIDETLWGVGEIWVSNTNLKQHTITKNMADAVNFYYIDGWGRTVNGVSSKQRFLEDFTRYRDIQNGAINKEI